MPILHLPIKSRIALQAARKIAPCDRALIHVCLAYLFLHSRQVLSSFKCYFKRKYLNLIDSNCDVDESCPWFFIGTVLVTDPECIINIYVILGRRNLFELGAVRSARESRSVALVWRLGILVTGAWFSALGGPFVFYNLYFFCTDLTKKWVSLLNVQFP